MISNNEQKAKEFLKNFKAVDKQKQAPISAPPWYGSSFTQANSLTDAEALARAYRNWYFALVNTVATNAAKTEFYFESVNADGEKEKIPNEWWGYEKFLEMPNEHYNTTFEELIKLYIWAMYTTGNFFLYPQKGDTSERIIYVWNMPNNVTPTITWENQTDRIPESLTFSRGRQWVIDYKELIHCRTLKQSNDLDSDFMGKPVYLDAAKDALLMDKELQGFAADFFANDMLPPIILKSAGEKSPASVATQKQAIASGLGKDHKVIVLDTLLDEELDAFTKSTSGSNVAGELNSNNIELLASIVGVPYALVTGQFPNRDTARIVKQSFYEETVNPWLNSFIEAFNVYMKNNFPNESARLAYVPTDFTYIQDKIASDNHMLSTGQATVNDLRNEANKEPIQGGDVPMWGLNAKPYEQAIREPVEPLNVESEDVVNERKKRLMLMRNKN